MAKFDYSADVDARTEAVARAICRSQPDAVVDFWGRETADGLPHWRYSIPLAQLEIAKMDAWAAHTPAKASGA